MVGWLNTAAAPLTILPIGDSITQGGRATVKEYSYRWPLARMLDDEGVCFDFIGSRTAGLDQSARWPRAWDDDHEAYYGATANFVRAKLAEHLPKLPPPDIALVHLGTNGRAQDTVRSLSEIIALLRASNPRVTVLVAQIPATFARAAYLHFHVSRLVSNLSTAESVVVAVDQHTDWDKSADTFDGVHPNLKGQRKIAEHWLDAMRPFIIVDACATPRGPR